MNPDTVNDNPTLDYTEENREAEKLAQALECPISAQKLGDEAYELVKQEMAKQ